MCDDLTRRLRSSPHDKQIALTGSADRAGSTQAGRQRHAPPVRSDPHNQVIPAQRQPNRALRQTGQFNGQRCFAAIIVTDWRTHVCRASIPHRPTGKQQRHMTAGGRPDVEFEQRSCPPERCGFVNQRRLQPFKRRQARVVRVGWQQRPDDQGANCQTVELNGGDRQSRFCQRGGIRA